MVYSTFIAHRGLPMTVEDLIKILEQYPNPKTTQVTANNSYSTPVVDFLFGKVIISAENDD